MKNMKTTLKDFLNESKEYDDEITGKRIKLIHMEDKYTNLKEGDEGTIKGVDGIGQIMVKWDNGSSLSIIPEIDKFEILEQYEQNQKTNKIIFTQIINM